MKMNILFPITIVLIFIVSGFSNTIVTSKNTYSLTIDNGQIMKFTISFPDINNIEIINRIKEQTIELVEFNNLNIPGKPMLPVKTYFFALPPGGIVTSVIYKEGSSIRLDGDYDILPAERILLMDSSNYHENQRLRDEWVTNYQTTYHSDQPFPEEPFKVVGYGTLRKYSYVCISICPFRYYPKSKQLDYLESIEITVDYNLLNFDNFESIKLDTIADDKASNIFANYDDVKDIYKPHEQSSKRFQDSYDYVIITNNQLKNIISSSDFLNWKSDLGYNITIVSITDSEITSQSGIDLAEKIRNFLREYYIDWGIKYVLIAGDYTTVPMRYCSPNPNSVEDTVPTDIYYADLSYSDNESWDSNGDNYYGVYGQDNPDFMPEIYVGRIPTSDITRLIYTLDKITSFEQDHGSWKTNALMGGAMLFYANEDHNEDIEFDIDGACLIYHIDQDFMNEWITSKYSEYEGLSPSIYPFNSLSEEAFTEDWRNGQYGVVNWAAHGAPSAIGRVIWEWDDGDNIPESENDELTFGSFLNTYSNLEDDFPSIVFAVSCNVGYPESDPNGNLGIDLLTKESLGAAVAICCATRGAAISVDWVTSHSGAEALCYEFNNYMINYSLRIGEALYDSKAYVHYNFGWDHEYEFMNMYDYNLYGDPSLKFEGIDTFFADYTISPELPSINDEIIFIDNSFDLYGVLINWTWDFDDGNSSYDQNPIHQYQHCGTYSVCLTIENNQSNIDTICKDVIILNEGEIIDINQIKYDRGFPIRHAIDGDWAAAQSYIPTVNMITRVEISMRKFGTPEFNLTVELRENHPQGTLLDTKVFTPDEVPSSWEWFSIDFEDVTIAPGAEYFIVCPPAPSGVTTSFGYEWRYAFGNQYDDGAFWFTRDGGGLWRDLPTMYEFVFRTYGYN